jgi:hypothetical protein
VNDTGEDVPGYSVVLAVPASVMFELVPTLAVPDPEPLVVKYAYAPIDATAAMAAPRAMRTQVLFLKRVIRFIPSSSPRRAVVRCARMHNRPLGRVELAETVFGGGPKLPQRPSPGSGPLPEVPSPNVSASVEASRDH